VNAGDVKSEFAHRDSFVTHTVLIKGDLSWSKVNNELLVVRWSGGQRNVVTWSRDWMPLDINRYVVM